jgi:hypothetical protein
VCPDTEKEEKECDMAGEYKVKAKDGEQAKYVRDLSRITTLSERKFVQSTTCEGNVPASASPASGVDTLADEPRMTNLQSKAFPDVLPMSVIPASGQQLYFGYNEFSEDQKFVANNLVLEAHALSLLKEKNNQKEIAYKLEEKRLELKSWKFNQMNPENSEEILEIRERKVRLTERENDAKRVAQQLSQSARQARNDVN